MFYRSFTATSPSAASTKAIQTQIIGGLEALDAMKIVTVFQGATGGDLDIYLQVGMKDATNGDDTTITWVDYARWTIAAGAASATKLYSVSRQTERLTGLTVAIGDTPAIATNTVSGGDFGDRMRVIFISQTGTSAGAAQTIHFFGSPAKRRV